MSCTENTAADFTAYAAEKIRLNLAQCVRCAALLSEPELWRRANEHCNSVGNLLLHLTGNVRQWILEGVAGETPLTPRDRPAEFAARGPLPHAQTVEPFREVLERAAAYVERISAAQLAEDRRIQGYAVSVQRAIFHVVEHLSFHTGQIVHITKVLKSADLSLYDALGRKKGVGTGP